MVKTFSGAVAGAVLLLCLTGFGASAATNPYGVAVIIGNKNYANGRVPEVSFAHRDADAFKRYVLDVLGYRPENIVDLRDATQAQMETAFGNERSHEGQLWSYLDPKGRSDIVVYYSGHGVPGLKDRRGYLLPSNANPDTAEINGYPIDLLYGNLGKLEEARSIRVFLDACFSGDSHHGMLVRSASPVFVQAEVPKTTGNLTVLTAASDEQVASWDETAEHGLFTHHLLDALYGEADANGDSQVTATEVKDYLDGTMTVAARRTYLRRQVASLNGSGETVLAVATGEVTRTRSSSRQRTAAGTPAAGGQGESVEATLGLSRAERIAIQKGLNALDLNAGPADGMFGPKSRDAIKAWQQAKGFPATGYLDADQAEALVSTGQDVAVLTPQPASTPASVIDDAVLMGAWSVDWKGANHHYTGTMQVDQRLGDNRFHGVVTVKWNEGKESVTQQATIEVSGNEVTINCYDPDRGWNPDNFFVTLAGDRMEGHSVDDSGQRGSSIVFTR